MIVIRSLQRESLRHAVRLPFYKRVNKFLEETIPHRLRGISVEDRLVRITVADRNATKYGLYTERGITQFVSLTFIVGQEFDSIPEVHTFLQLSLPDPETKIDMLLGALARLNAAEVQS